MVLCYVSIVIYAIETYNGFIFKAMLVIDLYGLIVGLNLRLVEE